ncbi:gustatory receptor for sugar taste 43a-like [Leguminivora glycinivorella]|uniref:gustatory receptor for sugar taste 43a-like n=1 Tax=Leguminivora glycinivorella TaxID=1035111 RepID=UPI002010B031|nr:gustatory receptor for sugar taste 43a-like [Leguminivora glycinivorella]
MTLLIGSLAIYRGQAQMKTLKRVLDQLERVYFDLKVSAPSTTKVQVKNVAMVIVLLWMASVVLMEFVSYYMKATSKGDTMWTLNLCFGVRYITDLQGMMAVVKWTCTVLPVYEGATALNQHLIRLRHVSELSILPGDISLKKSEALASSVLRLARSYERMSDIMRQMGDANGLFLMAVLTSTFLRLVITPYYMLYLNEVHGLTLSINWMIIHLVVLMLTIEPCEWTHAQRQHTALLLSQLIVQQSPNDEQLSRQLEQFADQLMMSSTQFSSLGIYTLDRKLTAAILGGVTTYLVIIIQFQTT